MVARAKIVASDFLRLCQVCGLVTGARWLGAVALEAKDILRSANLQPADAALGPGPFDCRLRGARARLSGQQVISGIREIWCRDVYLGGQLAIEDGDVVVDLGANMGNFTMLALGHGPRVRAVAVEPNPELVQALKRQLEVNGWSDRCLVLNAFVGEPNEKLHELRRQGMALGGFLSDADVLAAAGGGSIALLKCDIEGSEYSALGSDSPLLAASRQLAFELHYGEGDKDGFLERIRRAGFSVWCAREAPNDGVYRAVRPSGDDASPTRAG